MYESKKTPGKRFGSIFAGHKYDEAHTEDGVHEFGKEPEHEEKESPEFEAGEQEGKVENEAEGEPEQKEEEEHPVVAEHGAAHKVVIHHDHEAKRHTVTSHHKDGHTHTAVHPSAVHAHDEGKRLAGLREGADSGEGRTVTSTHTNSTAEPESDGFSMPSL
jgi:hypothetical protein